MTGSRADVVITTVEGKIVEQLSSHDMHQPISVSSLADGIYVLKCTTVKNGRRKNYHSALMLHPIHSASIR
jgi:hypothetical protein